ncbi:MAG: DNA helicase PriA [Candidatus Riflebacteria bacterium]|nr:DNA helicase PriA [Candidatus Riflebacteria bacterium]
MAVENYKCKTCSAPATFDIKLQKWHCDYCDSTFEKDELESSLVAEDELIEAEEGPEAEKVELNEYRCTACGAEILTEGNTAATFCIYCQNPSVIKSRFEGKFKPRYIIPFKITKDEAKKMYLQWIRKRIFAPSEFRVGGKVEKIRGLYAPYWLFNCHAAGYIEGEGRNSSSHTSGNYRITETKHYYIKRSGYSDYDKVPVDGSENLPDEMMYGIEPFNYNDIRDFSMQYMSGYLAEKYDVDSDKAKNALHKRVEEFLRKTLEGTGTRYSSVTISGGNVNLSDVKVAYAMLPIYILTNIYKGKKHRLMINGQTGKIYGEAPFSIMRFLVFTFLLFVVLGVIITAGVTALYVI